MCASNLKSHLKVHLRRNHIHVLVWKEFFTTVQFKTTSEDTHWCERIYVLECEKTFITAYRIETAREDPHWRETLQLFTL